MLQPIHDYYNQYDEDGRLTSKHGQVEFLTTMRYIQRYLSVDARVLEIGAGTGRYSHALAAQGVAVDAVELVAHNIEIFREKITPQENITIRQGDATDLSFLAEGGYDLTLLLGPMYHLFTERRNSRRFRKRFGSQSAAAWSLSLTASATRPYWTTASSRGMSSN